MAGDGAVPGGQDRDHAGVQRHLHVHVGAVPHARAPLAARLLLHGGPRRLHRRAADASAGNLFVMQFYTLNQYASWRVKR